MIIKSAITGRTYDDEDVVFYKNAKQSSWMLNNNVILLDVLPTNDNYLIFVFSKNDHKKYIKCWANNPH